MENNGEKFEKTAEISVNNGAQSAENAPTAVLPESDATVEAGDLVSFVPKRNEGETVVFTENAPAAEQNEQESAYYKEYEKAQTERADEFTEKIYSNLTLDEEEEQNEEEKAVREKAAESKRSGNFIFDCIEMLVISVVFVITLFTFGVRNVFVDGHSMTPTLNDKDMLLITDVASYNYGDIIVFVPEGYMHDYRLQKPFIKRVIALEGDEVFVDYIENTVYVNGVALDEPYIGDVIMNSMDDDTEYPFTVPENHIFFMGDNRNGSWDSRATAVGTVDERHIMGKVILRLFPFDSFGRVD
ncbi:MAG: signal peptidase I [Clostridia bacterium]|nr:signal peptidase I [Clostridia bacterium]